MDSNYEIYRIIVKLENVIFSVLWLTIWLASEANVWLAAECNVWLAKLNL